MGSTFHKLFLDHEIGRNHKVARLKPQERWAFVAGVLPLAAKSPLRGALLLIDDVHVDAADVARQADVTPAVARATLNALRALGMLEEDQHGVEWVHDFDVYNPEPPKDPTAAERQQRARDKKRAARDAERDETVTSRRDGRDADRDEIVTVTPPQVEEEEQDPPTPLPGGDGDQTRSRTALKPPAFKRRPVSPERARLVWQLVAEVNRIGQVEHQALKADGSWSDSASRVLGALDGYPVIDLPLGRRMIELAAERRWWKGPMHAKHVFAPGTVETLLQEARRPQLVQTGTTATGEPDRLPGETDTQRSNRLKAAGRERAAQRAAEHDAAEAGR